MIFMCTECLSSVQFAVEISISISTYLGFVHLVTFGL